MVHGIDRTLIKGTVTQKRVSYRPPDLRLLAGSLKVFLEGSGVLNR